MSKNKNIDKARLESRIMTMIENGREEITTKKQLEKYEIGSLISYMNNSNEFRTGGFIIKFCDTYFIFITPDFKTKYRVKYNKISKMWVGDVYNVRNDTISFAESIKLPTNFVVELNGKKIYYGQNTTDIKRFRCTDKYKRLLAWNNYFNT